MRARAVLVLALAVAPVAKADDVDLIPTTVTEEVPTKTAPEQPRATTFHGKFFLEDALSAWSAPTDVPVPYPASLVVGWQNRSSFDASLKWQPWKRFAVTLSDRINVFAQDDAAFLTWNTLRNDFREGYVSWEPASNTFFEVGRVNVRNGVSLGFNPTDFFKARALVGQASLDPSVIRQNRLGTLMVRAETLWKGGSASVAYAPKVAEPSPISESNPIGVDPRFDATNSAHRVLCALNFDFANLSPEVLGYFELHRSKVGLNLSYPIGDAVVAYAEWAGGPEANLITRAVSFGQATGTLPQAAPVVPPTDTATAFRNDLAAGFSWVIAKKVTLNVEYHLHEAGFGQGDWKRWFALGSMPGAPTALTNELWFIRGYALDQQEPVSQHQLFVRASWPRALVPELELSAFAFVDLLDGSVLTQVSASYYLSDAWTASVFVSATVGDDRSERGSFPQHVNAIFQLTRYL